MEQKTILVIDDVEENADIIKTKLQYAGFTAVIATDGESGVKMALEQKPHLILCDIMLPQMDGWEVLKQLRQDPNTATIPVIFMTAYTTLHFSGEKKRAKEEGAVDFLKKPFDLSEMVELVRKYTAGS